MGTMGFMEKKVGFFVLTQIQAWLIIKIANKEELFWTVLRKGKSMDLIR